MQRPTESTILGLSWGQSHKTFGFWPKAEAEAKSTNYSGIDQKKGIIFWPDDDLFEFYLILYWREKVFNLKLVIYLKAILNFITNQLMKTNKKYNLEGNLKPSATEVQVKEWKTLAFDSPLAPWNQLTILAPKPVPRHSVYL